MTASDVIFGSLFEFIRNGLSIRQERLGSGLPITRIETISAGFVDGSRVGFADLDESDCSNWLLQPGDILFSHINSVEQIGKCAIYDGIPAKLVHGMNLLCLRPNQAKIVPRYAQALIRSPGFRAKLSKFINKAVNQASVSIGNLKTIVVRVPNLPEQRRIATILDHAEALRAKRRESLAKLDALVNSVFLDLFGDPESNSANWKTVILKDLLESPLRNGLSPSNSGRVTAKVLTLSAITGESFRPEAWKEAPFQRIPPADQRVSKDDLLICRGNGNVQLVGKGYFPTSDMPDITFPDTIIAARVSTDRVVPLFLQAIWNAPATRRQVESLARTTNGTLKVNQTILEGIRIIAPPLALQNEFAGKIQRVEKLRAVQQASLASLDALFASLQNRAFRGDL